MKVYHADGRVYEGEPVDCRELMQVGGFLKDPSPAVPSAPGAQAKNAEIANLGKPSQSALDTELAALPAQVRSGAIKNVEATVRGLKMRYGALFTADNEASVRALFPAPTGTGRPSAKVGK